MSGNGFILLDKPAGITSHAALGGLKKALGTSRVGHSGTLDKFATGLLVALAGDYSRLAPWFSGMNKEYEATVFLGAETDTLDPEGQVVAECDPPPLEDLERALDRFRGKIFQAPPAYSAVHVGGKRASDLARKGKAPEMAPREVEIEEIRLLGWSGTEARIFVRCSSGTYIRSLARDLGTASGSRAYLTALRRTKVGPFSVEDAVPADAADPIGAIRPFTRTLAESMGLGTCGLRPTDEKAFSNGAAYLPERIGPPGFFGDCAVFAEDGFFAGMISRGPKGSAYRVVMSRRGEE